MSFDWFSPVFNRCFDCFLLLCFDMWFLSHPRSQVHVGCSRPPQRGQKPSTKVEPNRLKTILTRSCCCLNGCFNVFMSTVVFCVLLFFYIFCLFLMFCWFFLLFMLFCFCCLVLFVFCFCFVLQMFFVSLVIYVVWLLLFGFVCFLCMFVSSCWSSFPC